MEHSLSLNLGQKLAMTAKLQQAIQILQLSAQDLRDVIEKEYLENPALEMEDSFEDHESGEKTTDRYSIEEIASLANYLGSDTAGKAPVRETMPAFEAVETPQETLAEVLLEQVNFSCRPGRERRIAKYIVGSIDSRGYLRISTGELAAALQVDEQEVLAILQVIQGFEPAGVGARNLAECLRIQAQQQGIYKGLIALIIEKHLDRVAAAQFKQIAEMEDCSPGDVQLAVDIIRRLNPKPGCSYGGDRPDYIVPDIIVRKVNEEYVVLVNGYGIPKLNITALYRNNSGFDDDTKKYIEQRVNTAVWLIKSIEQRRQTLFNVVTEIVRVQRDFFDKGEAHLHPMLMRTVADAIGVHESTVSRAVANKYMEMPHGVISLKKFFAANLAGSQQGEELIAAQVKAMIKQLILEENSQKPWSDQQLSEMLAEKQMKISRRTVMKYREQLGYPSSVKRKRY
jgi:RNA polymerase sigma-54 factor